MNIEVPERMAARRAISLGSSLSRVRRDLRALRIAITVLVVIAALALAAAAADLLAPTAIALTLALVLAPIARFIERLGLPAGLASVVAVLSAVAVIGGSAVALAPEAANLLGRAPSIAQSIERKLRPVTRQIAAFERASEQIARSLPLAPARSVAVAGDGLFLSVARRAPSIVENSIYVTVLTIFLLACRRRYTDQLILFPKTYANRLRMARICRDVQHKVSGYLFVLAVINTGLALITALCFYQAGIGDPLLWGIAFGIMNFIPFIGPTVVILAAAIFGFATADTIPHALAPPLILLALNTVEANLVQPWLLSRRIVISPVAIFLTVVTLVWLWGPLAAITAVPLLIFFHTVALQVPSLQRIGYLLGTENVQKKRITPTARRTEWPPRSPRAASSSSESSVHVPISRPGVIPQG
jgi:predicted PurR-regulated permease PerM